MEIIRMWERGMTKTMEGGGPSLTQGVNSFTLESKSEVVSEH